MQIAAANGHIDTVALLLKYQADPNASNKQRTTALHAAAAVKAAGAMLLLLDAKSATDARDANKQSPLHVSARAGSVEAVQLLLGAGSRALNTRDKWQRSPILWAVLHQNSEVSLR